MFFGIPPDHGIVYGIILYGTGAIIIAMFVRVIASWFRPIRRIIRPVGIIDIAFFIGFFLVITMQRLLLQSLPSGW